MADISVLMAAYNAADTIERAITSARNQDDLITEIIVCDDGSSDETAARARLLADIVVESEGVGQAEALNRCAEVATSDLFIQLDADDWLEPNSLVLLAAALEIAPEHVGFAYGATRFHGDLQGVYQPPAFRVADFWRTNASLYCVLYRRLAWDRGCRYRSTGIHDLRGVGPQDWDFELQLIHWMRYDGAAQASVVLNHVHRETGTLSEHNADADVLAGFRELWPGLRVERL